MAEITWTQPELVEQLKNRLTAIYIRLENIDNVTDRSVTIYSIVDDSSAVPPPSAVSWQTTDQVQPGHHNWRSSGQIAVDRNFAPLCLREP
jgi:hypothetical protein